MRSNGRESEDARRQSVDFYQSEASDYDARRWSSSAGRYLDETQQSIVSDLIGDIRGKKVLDVATGTGRFAIHLASRGAHVHAVDTSTAMLDTLVKKSRELGVESRITVHQADAANLPFDELSFDAVTCINALNHIPDAAGVVRDMSRVAASSSRIVTNFTVWSSIYLPFGLAVNLRSRSITRDVYTHWFSKREILSICEKSGIELEDRVGAMQFPSWVNNPVLLNICTTMDRFVRRVPSLAPMLFIAATKSDLAST